jgi:hypothetical protein
MNPQLTFSLAQSHRQDLERAARASRAAAGLSTGSNLTARLRESVAALRTSHRAARPTGTAPAVTGV